MKHLCIYLVFISIIGCSVTKPLDIENPHSKTVQPSSLKPEIAVQEKLFSLLYKVDLTAKDLEGLEIYNFDFLAKNGQTPSEILFSLNSKEKIQLFEKIGLTIYQSNKNLDSLFQNDLQEAKDFLNKLAIQSKNRVVSQEISKSFDYHRELFNEIFDDLNSGETAKAIGKVQSLGLTCPILYKSIVPRSFVYPQNIASKKILNFIQKLGCSNSLNSNEISLLYNLEAKRIFQERFKDVSLFIALLNSPALKTKMIQISDFGISISPWFLFGIGQDCKFDSAWLENELNEDGVATGNRKYTYRTCNVDKYSSILPGLRIVNTVLKNELDPILEKCRSKKFSEKCLNDVGFLSQPYNLLLIVDNKRLFSSAKEDPAQDLLIMPYIMIEATIYGFNDEPAYWKSAFPQVFEPSINYFAPDESQSRTIKYRGEPKFVSFVKKSINKIQSSKTLEKKQTSLSEAITELHENFNSFYFEGKSEEDVSADENPPEKVILEKYLRSLQKNLFSDPTSFGQMCNMSYADFERSSMLSPYQLSLRYGPQWVLIPWDYLNALCAEPALSE
ncbi:hypothetical protein DOM22_07580 [Bdellovibrio sp. ZAP7]|uniref:hypothetical protein n=1 Tax=Bdellovibrio sp. ZAP7 TaxID=2231053 RepID=UPI0011575D38|nr:hypothetical protein [Bdellovibrio sp. ZAP7]QDK45030.1 hypothetical protein DOM22_07580 [Bdellovibrio sp. ZAP7]